MILLNHCIFKRIEKYIHGFTSDYIINCEFGINYFAKYEHLSLLRNCKKIKISNNEIGYVSRHGYLDILEWLINECRNQYKQKVIQHTLKNKFNKYGDMLYETPEGSRVGVIQISVMDEAIINGHLDVLKLLYKNGFNDITQNGMKNCNAEIFRWLKSVH
jgi:hypothetical protein